MTTLRCLAACCATALLLAFCCFPGRGDRTDPVSPDRLPAVDLERAPLEVAGARSRVESKSETQGAEAQADRGPVHTLEVRCFSPEGGLIPDAALSVRRHFTGPEIEFSVSAAGDRQLVSIPEPEAEYRVRASHPTWGDSPWYTIGGFERTADVWFSAAKDVSITVLDGYNRPLPGVTVRVSPSKTMSHYRQGKLQGGDLLTTDELGRAQTRIYEGHRWTISAKHAGARSQWTGKYTNAPPDIVLRIEDRYGAQGRVLDLPPTATETRRFVSFAAASSRTDFEEQIQRMTSVGLDARDDFRAKLPHPGLYRSRIQIGTAWAWGPYIEVTDAEPWPTVEIRAPQSYDSEFRIVHRQGFALHGASVRLAVPGNAPGIATSLVGEGTWRVQGLSPGPHDICIVEWGALLEDVALVASDVGGDDLNGKVFEIDIPLAWVKPRGALPSGDPTKPPQFSWRPSHKKLHEEQYKDLHSWISEDHGLVVGPVPVHRSGYIIWQSENQFWSSGLQSFDSGVLECFMQPVATGTIRVDFESSARGIVSVHCTPASNAVEGTGVYRHNVADGPLRVEVEPGTWNVRAFTGKRDIATVEAIRVDQGQETRIVLR